MEQLPQYGVIGVCAVIAIIILKIVTPELRKITDAHLDYVATAQKIMKQNRSRLARVEIRQIKMQAALEHITVIVVKAALPEDASGGD